MSSIIQAEILSPYHNSVPERSDIMGMEGVPGTGPFMQMYLSVDAETVSAAHFQTYGCPIAIACGSWVARWVEGKSLEAATKIDANALTLILGGLPLGKEHCAALAVNALHNAVKRCGAQS